MPSSGPQNFANIRCSFARLAVLLLVAGPLLPACSPEIGDSCGTALDCSASGTRLCDDTQPGGYCTLEGCEQDTCPPESICVKFGKVIDGVPVDRLARSFCMYKCDGDSDCRNGDGYSCFYAGCPKGSKDCSEEPIFGAGASGSTEAKILGNESQKFCAAIPLKVDTSRLDAGKPDAGKPDEEEDAGMSMPPEPDTAMMSMPDGSSGN
ncbi:MAG TPA: hypothetical protein VJV78_16270 [Polyangiales bacterium]|nr:hypothetical protein [Polyangiales bacterium]